MYPYLSDDCKVVRVMDAQAAGATDVNGTGVSLAGFDGVMFVALLGTLTATQVTQIKAQQSSDDGSADAYTDIEGSESVAMDDADDNLLLFLDIFRPQEEYVRAVLERATANAVIDGMIAILYHAKDRPITQDTSVSQYVQLADPIAGTGLNDEL